MIYGHIVDDRVCFVNDGHDVDCGPELELLNQNFPGTDESNKSILGRRRITTSHTTQARFVGSNTARALSDMFYRNTFFRFRSDDLTGSLGKFLFDLRDPS